MLNWITPLALLLLVSAAFALLILTYRRQDAMEESFLCSILLAVAGCAVPDAWFFLPAVWWAFTILWSNHRRMYLASLCGLLLCALYAAVIFYRWPESIVARFVQESVQTALQRRWCVDMLMDGTLPLWWAITGVLAAIVGIWMLIAHLSKYARANVRTQTLLLIAVPFLLLSLLSCLFPMQNGNSLLVILVVAALYLFVLYIVAYGFPRIRLRPRRRKSSRRPLKRRPSSYR